MSAGTALMVIGLVVALVGVGLAAASYRPPSADAVFAPDEMVVATGFEQLSQVFHRIDKGVRSGVAVAVVGLLVAGVGAYLGSDARALGADVGGTGTGDHNRIGGSW
jgi:hypothetical protein